MDINSCYALIQYIANKSQNGNITPVQFNLLAPIAQMSVINDRLGNVKKYRPHDPVPPFGWGISQKVREELGVLYTGIPLSISSGFCAQPAGVLYYDTMLTQFTNGKIITEKMIDEWTRDEQSVLKPPSLEYPVYCRFDQTLRFLPASLTSALLFCIREPLLPVWAYNITGGVPVYDPSGSQDFELSPLTQFEVCMRILGAVGINLSVAEVMQYAELQEQKGT